MNVRKGLSRLREINTNFNGVYLIIGESCKKARIQKNNYENLICRSTSSGTIF